MNDILSLREAAALLKIDCNTNKKTPTRKIKNFLSSMEKVRGIKMLFNTKGKYYVTLISLKKCIPEAFEDESIKPFSSDEDIKEDVSEEALEVIKELAHNLKDQMKQLRGRNKHLQDQITAMDHKYQDLEDKYNAMVNKVYFNK
jgi:predicted RNase H-like nuclease (RuvC/YqgF family)